MNKKVILIVMAVIIGVIGFLVFTEPNQESTTVDASNHVVGDGSTGVALVEYGDFQCPACAQYHPIVNDVIEKYKDQITFQFINFPLESIHKNARAASRAAEAANVQGKFWEMYDKLYEAQSQWQDTTDPLSTFEGYAQEIGITDISKFTEDYKSTLVNSIINADLEAGRALGITGTPTFFLDGEKIENPATPNAFNELIEAAIAKKTGTNNQNNSNSPDTETDTTN